MNSHMIRSMVADEMYYPGEPDDLRRQLQEALANAPVLAGSSPVVVGPYGSYELTLPYVMQALKAAANRRPEVIVLVAPPHSTVPERALLPESDVFDTPFGPLPVDQPALEFLTSSTTLFEVDEIAHLRDHSIETMLPAVHHLFGPLPVLPILVGDLPPKMLEHAARLIPAALEDRTYLTVVSANLSGFTTPRNADARARAIIRLILESPGTTVLTTMQTIVSPPRSLVPIVLGHLLAGNSARPTILSRGTYETEFDGDTGSVVIGSIAYTI